MRNLCTAKADGRLKVPWSELSWQTRNARQLGAEQAAVLCMERLEDRALEKCPGDIFSEGPDSGGA